MVSEREAIVEINDLEKVSFTTQILILGFAMSIFSWFGFILSLVFWISLFFLKSRREKKILYSDLAEDEVQTLLKSYLDS